MAGMAIPYEKKPYEQKTFLAARIGGGEEEVPTECGEIPMVSELEGWVNRSATTLKLPKMSALARMDVKRTKTVSKPDCGSSRCRRRHCTQTHVAGQV